MFSREMTECFKFENFEKGGGGVRLFEGAIKRRGSLIKVIRYLSEILVNWENLKTIGRSEADFLMHSYLVLVGLRK